MKIDATNKGNGKQIIKPKGGNVTIKIGSTIVIIGIALILLFTMKKINDPRKQIIGTWETESGFTYVFQENGQYSHDGGWFGTYTVEGDMLTLCPVLNNPEVYEISVSSDGLIIKKNGEVYRELKKLN